MRTHYIEYTVTDGGQTVTGLVRIDVAAPPDANTRPITVPQTVFVTTLSSETVDATPTDIDPAGGVLVRHRTCSTCRPTPGCGPRCSSSARCA